MKKYGVYDQAKISPVDKDSTSEILGKSIDKAESMQFAEIPPSEEPFR